MRAFSAAAGLWFRGAFKGRGRSWRPLILQKTLLDRDLFALGSSFLGQRQLEHAVAELGLGLGFVDFLRQREAARHLAEYALGVQHALVLGSFLLLLHFGGERDLRAVDRYADVVLLYTGQLRRDLVGPVLLGDVHLYAGKHFVAAA